MNLRRLSFELSTNHNYSNKCLKIFLHFGFLSYFLPYLKENESFSYIAVRYHNRIYEDNILICFFEQHAISKA